MAEHMLAALLSAAPTGTGGGAGGGEGAGISRASPQFVRALFDDFSETFDAKLDALQYRVPWSYLHTRIVRIVA